MAAMAVKSVVEFGSASSRQTLYKKSGGSLRASSGASSVHRYTVSEEEPVPEGITRGSRPAPETWAIMP
jgi:hypothetical protein